MKILSYPRSGSNFLYYSLSVIGIYLGKTHGQNKEFWLDKESDKKLVFMIRNYKESIPRQIDGYKFDDRFCYTYDEDNPYIYDKQWNSCYRIKLYLLHL